MFKSIAILSLVCTFQCAAFCQTAGGIITGQEGIREIRLEAFVRSDRDSADEVKAYLDNLNERVRGLDIRIHDVLTDREQLTRLYELSEKFGRKAVVPSFYSCNRMYFGFGGQQMSGPSIEAMFTADVYTRSTCPKCQNAKRFISQLERTWPAVNFRIYEITTDAVARGRWQEICRAAGQVPGLPTIDFARNTIIGYQGDHITGRQLESLIERVSGTAQDDAAKPALNDTSWNFPSASSWLGTVSMLSAGTHLPLTAFFFATHAQQVDELGLPEEADESEIGEGVADQPPDTAVEIDQSITLPILGKIRVNDLGLPAFTFAVGLVDGFNPCAMWVLVFLLSVLVNIRDRRKIIAIAGTFVVVSGLAYFAFMAAWLNVFTLIGLERRVQITLGLFAILIGVVNVKDFFAFKKGLSFSIPESSKPGLYRRVRKIVSAKYLTVAISGAISLAVVVNLIEFLCTAGLPALYSQILMMQELPAWKNYMYLGLYISAYMLDDTMLLTVVIITLSHRKLQEREGRWLKFISGIVILALGVVMIFRPAWLMLGH